MKARNSGGRSSSSAVSEVVSGTAMAELEVVVRMREGRRELQEELK